MCELLVYSAQSPYTLNNILNSFYKRSKFNPHGWGQAIIDRDNPEIEKEPINASRSVFLHELLKKPIDSKALLAHIRYATTGDMKYENTHPFEKIDDSGRKWVLIHNGTVIQDEDIQKYESVQAGDTDSERILFYLIDRVNEKLKEKNRQLTPEERFEIVDNLVHILSKDNNKLNLIISDQEQIYIHTNGLGQMYQSPVGDGILFCTRSLMAPNEVFHWTPTPRMRTLCYRDGKLINYGQEHGNEYIPDPEIEKELISRYAHLS